MVNRLCGALALCLLLLSLPRTGQAQLPASLTWQNAYGTSRNETGGLLVAVPGGYLLAGQQSYFNGTAALLYFVRTNLQGDTLWTKTLPGPGGCINPVVTGLVRDAAGNLLLTGLSYTANFGFVAKLTANGTQLWERTRQLTVPGATFSRTSYSSLLDTDGNYVVVESGSHAMAQGPDVLNQSVLKLDQASGAELWATSLSAFYSATFHSAAAMRGLFKTPTGFTAIIYGSTSPSYTPATGQLKLSATGVLGAFKMRPDTAAMSSTFSRRDGTNNILILERNVFTKLNPTADTIWSRRVTYGSSRQWNAAAITQDRQGNYVVLANSYFYVGGSRRDDNIHLARFRPNGQLVNDTMLYRPGQTHGYGLHLAANGDLVVSGDASGAPNGGTDLFMLQFRGFRPLASRAAEATAAGFGAYPNPAAGPEAVRLTLPELPGPLALAVFDGLGRAVRHQALPAAAREAALPVAGLPPGLYLLRLRAADGRTWTTKLLRE